MEPSVVSRWVTSRPRRWRPAESPFYKRFLPTTAEEWSTIAFYPYDIYFKGDNWAKDYRFLGSSRRPEIVNPIVRNGG